MNKGLLEFAELLDREADDYERHGVRCGIKTSAPALLRKLAVQARLRAVAEKSNEDEQS